LHVLLLFAARQLLVHGRLSHHGCRPQEVQ
ncbi:hypothetical protein BN1708_019784, partial [Verticillium longisporum]